MPPPFSPPPTEFYSGFRSNVTTAAPSPTASTYNLNLGLQLHAELVDNLPESRVLIIMTGGTICMHRSENGYVPVRPADMGFCPESCWS